jgi:hypothetical protein
MDRIEIEQLMAEALDAAEKLQSLVIDLRVLADKMKTSLDG